jgi:hypothetical protein
LFRLAVELVLLDVVEHLPVHQDIEQRKISLLVDQCTGLERLVERLLNHVDDHDVGIGVELTFASRGRRNFIRPLRRGPSRQHHVEKLLEMGLVLPFGFRVRHGLIDRTAVGRSIQRDKCQPGIEIETAL